MKLTRSLSAVLLGTVLLLLSCQSNPVKEKLAGTWKLTNMSGPGAVKIPDSIKQEMYGTRFMEFTADGDMIASGGKARMQKGTYILGADGKSLLTTVNGRASDTMFINELSKDKLVLSLKKDTLVLTMIPK